MCIAMGKLQISYTRQESRGLFVKGKVGSHGFYIPSSSKLSYRAVGLSGSMIKANLVKGMLVKIYHAW